MSTQQLDVLFAPFGVDPLTHRAYTPHPTQARISQWVREVRAGKHQEHGVPTLWLQHGVNAGGTRGALTPILEYAFEQPGLKVLVGRKEFVDLRRSVMVTFFDVVPPELIAKRDEQLHVYTLLTQGIGAVPAELHFQHLSDEQSLGSQQFGAILVVEAQEITERVFRALQRRARQGALPSFLILEGNPPTEGHWLSEMTNPRSDKYDPSVTKWELASTENWDFMTPAYQRMLQAMPAAWRRRYLLGQTGSLPDGTPVYPAFVESLHVRPTALIPDRPIIRSWDFGYRRAACAWMQRADIGQLLIHREWMALETPETAFIDGVKVRSAEWYADRACVDYGDPAARNRDPEGVSTLARLDQAGIKLLHRQSTYAERIPLINQRLSLLIGGQPAVVVDPKCAIIIEGFLGGYHYPVIDPEKRYTQKHEIPEHDQWFSHLMNCVEYAMVNLFLGAPTAYREQRRELVQARRQQLQRRHGVVSF